MLQKEKNLLRKKCGKDHIILNYYVISLYFVKRKLNMWGIAFGPVAVCFPCLTFLLSFPFQVTGDIPLFPAGLSSTVINCSGPWTRYKMRDFSALPKCVWVCVCVGERQTKNESWLRMGSTKHYVWDLPGDLRQAVQHVSNLYPSSINPHVPTMTLTTIDSHSKMEEKKVVGGGSGVHFH